MGRFKSRALTPWTCTNERSTIEKVRESSFNGVMDETSGKVEKAGTHASSFIVMYLAVVEIHHCAAALNEKVKDRSSNGVMDECSGRVQNAGTYVAFLIVMYLAVVEIHHCAGANNEKASSLQNKGREMSAQCLPTG